MPSAYFTLFYSFEVELHLSPNGDGNMEIMKMERLEGALRLIFNLQFSIFLGGVGGVFILLLLSLLISSRWHVLQAVRFLPCIPRHYRYS